MHVVIRLCTVTCKKNGDQVMPVSTSLKKNEKKGKSNRWVSPFHRSPSTVNAGMRGKRSLRSSRTRRVNSHASAALEDFTELALVIPRRKVCFRHASEPAVHC